MKNILSFKTFKQKRVKTFLPLPKWFDERTFITVRQYLNDGQKLHACKYLYDLSGKYNTRQEYGLTWAKTEICDQIEVIGGKPTFTSPMPQSSVVQTGGISFATGMMSNDDILRTIQPFVELAKECLGNSNLDRNQIVYAYNKATITMQDLRNIEALHNKLSRK